MSHVLWSALNNKSDFMAQLWEFLGKEFLYFGPLYSDRKHLLCYVAKDHFHSLLELEETNLHNLQLSQSQKASEVLPWG